MIYRKVENRSRGFEVVSSFADQNVTLPKRSTQNSAGYDIRILKGCVLYPDKTYIFDTGIKAYMLPDEVLSIHVRSSLGIKKNLILSNATGIIDSDYYNNPDNEGHIRIALTNIGIFPVKIEDNDRVAQGIFSKFLKVDNEEFVDNKRVGGIGSTLN